MQGLDYPATYGGWALVVGASEGLGAALASELASRGMNLVLVARRAAVLEAAAVRLSSAHGVEVLPLAADMSDPDAAAKLDARLADREVGFFIYNCAAEHRGEFLDQDLARHLDNIRVNVTAPTELVHAFGRRMLKRRRGGIVLTSSLAAAQGIYSWAGYGAAKAYEMILGEGLWSELKDHGVGATAFMVGTTYTPNFVRVQQEKGTVFAQSRTPEGLAPGIPVPQAPEDAAANLFRQIDIAWLPLIYANPADEANARAMRDMSRVDLINRIGDAMKSGYRSYAD